MCIRDRLNFLNTRFADHTDFINLSDDGFAFAYAADNDEARLARFDSDFNIVFDVNLGLDGGLGLFSIIEGDAGEIAVGRLDTNFGTNFPDDF